MNGEILITYFFNSAVGIGYWRQIAKYRRGWISCCQSQLQGCVQNCLSTLNSEFHILRPSKAHGIGTANNAFLVPIEIGEVQIFGSCCAINLETFSDAVVFTFIYNEEGLKSITASMPDQLTTFFEHLTPSEKDIAMMIMSGQTTKGIARIMSREPSTIEFHRNNIRKKLGLNKSGQNLRSKLLSIQKTWG